MAPGQSVFQNEDAYLELRQEIERAGLLNTCPAFYIAQSLFGFGLMAASIALLLWAPNPLVQLANAGLLAFAFTQIAFLGHDLGHAQVFCRKSTNYWVGCLVHNLVLGISFRFWVRSHSEHHGHPNHVDLDPDIHFPVVAFTEEHAASANRVAQWFIRRQSFFFFPLLTMMVTSLRLDSVLFLLRNPGRQRWVEAFLLTAHVALYCWLIFSALGLAYGLVFAAVNQALFGVYVGLSFASNHKGMPIVERDEKMPFMQTQLVTTRNLAPSRVTEFLFGSLGSQIEHHLFPTMPRPSLFRARAVVRAFCQSRSLPYYETGYLRAIKEVLAHLHGVGRSI